MQIQSDSQVNLQRTSQFLKDLSSHTLYLSYITNLLRLLLLLTAYKPIYPSTLTPQETETSFFIAGARFRSQEARTLLTYSYLPYGHPMTNDSSEVVRVRVRVCSIDIHIEQMMISVSELYCLLPEKESPCDISARL